MDLSQDTTQFSEATRRDGWTPALKARFLALLAESGNARLSARRCGLSAQSAYVQRRRDPVFARGWVAALVLARGHAEQVLADRALEGVEEAVFYRGEQIATRRRYDSRLLLAHLARLDRLVEDEESAGDADRFDEVLALVAGEEAPEALSDEATLLPAARERHADAAADAAEAEAMRELPRVRGAAARRERDEAVAVAGDEAWGEAVAGWDAWFDHACAVVDALEGDDPCLALLGSGAYSIPRHSRESGNPAPDTGSRSGRCNLGPRLRGDDDVLVSQGDAQPPSADGPASPPFQFAPQDSVNPSSSLSPSGQLPTPLRLASPDGSASLAPLPQAGGVGGGQAAIEPQAGISPDSSRALTLSGGCANGAPGRSGGHPSETVGASHSKPGGLISSLDGEKRFTGQPLPRVRVPFAS